MADLLGLVNRGVAKAFAITIQFQTDVTFQLQIVWNLDPINDLVTPVPTAVKTVKAVVYKPTLRRRDELTDYVYTENICCQQWTDNTPPPGINDRVLILTPYSPQPILRQILSVTDEPSHNVWIIETRLPTANN